MDQSFLQKRMRHFRRKLFLLAGGFLAVFFLAFELISAASSAIVVLSYYNQAKQECSNISSSDGDGDGDVSVGSYDKNIESMAYAVAQAMHKAYGYKPELVFAQLGHETGFKASYTNATKNFNLAGIKYTASMSDYAKPGESVGDSTGGSYAKFKSLDAFATVYYKQYLKPDFGKSKPKTVQEWAHLLKQHSYYTDTEDNYVAGMTSFFDEYKKYEAAHKNDSKKDSSSSSKKKTSTAKKKTSSSKKKTSTAKKKTSSSKKKTSTAKKKTSSSKKKTSTAKKKKTAVVVRNQKKTLSDLIVDVDKPKEAGSMNDLVKKENEKSTISETAKEDAKSTSKASKASSKSSSSKTSSKATSSSKASSKTSSKKDNSKSSSSKKDDSTDSSSDESNSESNLGMTEDSCKAMGFETEDDDNDSSGDWSYPFKGMTYKSAKAYFSKEQSFGPGTGGGRTNGYHDGVDFGNARFGGQAIRAIHDGKVIDVSVDSSDISGHVVTKSSDGWYIVYQEFYHAEGSKYVKVKKGQTVHAGDTIGILANTANAQGISHVHIGMTKKVWRTAIQDSFSSAGGLKDPIEMIKKGIASGGSLGSIKLTGDQKTRALALKKAMKKMDPKATDEGICAILGNWWSESRFDPTAVNPSSGASGLGQWLGTRFSALNAYAKKKGKSWKNADVQLEFAYKGEADSAIFKQVLEGKGTVADLARRFYRKWERGGDKYEQGHVDDAVSLEKILK